MYRVSVLYPNGPNITFNFDYYISKHVPFVAALVGRRIEVRRGLSLPTGAPAAFICIATIFIDSVEQFQTVLAQHGAEIMGDIPNYTNSVPVVQFDEVLQ